MVAFHNGSGAASDVTASSAVPPRSRSPDRARWSARPSAGASRCSMDLGAYTRPFLPLGTVTSRHPWRHRDYGTRWLARGDLRPNQVESGQPAHYFAATGVATGLPDSTYSWRDAGRLLCPCWWRDPAVGMKNVCPMSTHGRLLLFEDDRALEDVADFPTGWVFGRRSAGWNSVMAVTAHARAPTASIAGEPCA